MTPRWPYRNAPAENVGARLARYRGRPKKILLELCEHLTAVEATSSLSLDQKRALPVFVVPGFEGRIVAVNRPRGVRRWYWYLVCPSCLSRREALHRPPHAAPRDFRCVDCAGPGGLIHTSHRYKSQRVRASKQRFLGHRQKARVARARTAMERQAAKVVARQRRLAKRRARRALARGDAPPREFTREELERFLSGDIVIEDGPGGYLRRVRFIPRPSNGAGGETPE